MAEKLFSEFHLIFVTQPLLSAQLLAGLHKHGAKHVQSYSADNVPSI